MRAILVALIAGFLGTCSSPPPLLDQVLDLGELRVVTRNAPSTYFIGPDGPSGPEYDLVRGLADALDVELSITTVDNVADILPQLRQGKAHMAAAGLSATDARRKHLDFSMPYERVDMLLIYKLGTGKPRDFSQVVGRSIEVVADSSHTQMLEELAKTYEGLEWTENADEEVIDLLEKVALGDIDFTISDSTEFNIQRHFYPDLRVALDLEENDTLAWAFRKEDGASLLQSADDYLIAANRSGLVAQVHDRYYGHTKDFDYVGTRAFIRHFESRLPRFRELFEDAGREYNVDWRLLAAIGYQESHWRAKAVSPTGVRGIMMLTKATADYLDIEDRMDPENSIYGGARFFARQLERLPDSIEEPDRTWFALAAYNVGFNHLKDVRQIVEWQGGDPDTWIDTSDALPLLAKQKWYKRVQYGYARGWEPVLYVNNIRSYYNIIRWLTENEETAPVTDGSEDGIEVAATQTPATATGAPDNSSPAPDSTL